MESTRDRVLIADDEEGVRDLLVEAFAAAGCEAFAVSSGEEVLEVLSAGEPWDLVIADLKMPGMGGEEVVGHIARKYPDIPTVVMTGYPSLQSAELAVRSRVQDYIEKPFPDAGEVVTRVLKVLAARRDRAERIAGGLAQQNRELIQMREIANRKLTAAQRNLREQIRMLQKSREVFYTDLSRVMAIIDNLADGIIFTDPRGKVILINPAAGKLLGIPSFTALGRELSQVEGNRTLLSLLATHRSLRLSDEVAQAEVSTSVQGREAHFNVRTNSVPDFQGKISGVLSLIQDITLRKKTEQLKNQFLSIVAHELRTPLTAIKAFTSILDRGIYGEVPEAQRPVIQHILAQSERLGHEIDKIINLGRLEASDFQPDIVKVKASRILTNLLSPFQNEADEKHIAMSVEDRTDGVSVHADVTDIRRAIRALLENALKFTPEGGTAILRAFATEEHVIFEVADTGIGIDEHDHERIFEKFIQLENPLTRKHGGSGLGLSFAAEILKAHGSRIDVDSEPGAGATFRFRLSRTTAGDGPDGSSEPEDEEDRKSIQRESS